MCHLRMLYNKAFTERRMSSDLIINVPPFFCLDAGWWHAIRLFSCLVLRVNCKDLRLFQQNREFETGAFRRSEIRQNPPNSPFGDFRGHGNLPSCNCLICKENASKTPLIFLFLQQMQWRISIYEPQSFEHNPFQSKSYNKNRDFGIAHKCTPENRNSCVTVCYFAF